MLRNDGLGDFLKELDLTEGKSTGITTVRAKLKSNGSSAAIYEFDEERTYFSATVKIHPEFLKQQSDINVTQNVTQRKQDIRCQKILELIRNDRHITIQEIAKKLDVASRTINRDINIIRVKYGIKWIGPSKTGYWEIEE